jgi:hypothetical protein
LFIGHYVESNHALPRSLDDVNFVVPRPAGIQDVAINPHTGQLEVTLEVGYLRGKTFYLAPSVGAGGRLAWRCLHGDVPQRLMPAQCRYDTADPFKP